MPGQNEPKNEAVRIDSLLPIEGKTPERIIKETARIHLQTRADRGPVSEQFFRPEEPPLVSMPLSASVEPAPESTSSQDPSIAAAPAQKNSMLLIWILLGVSALILIIQIWTYVS